MSLSESCAKALSDKTYEKRKMGAVEVEKYFLVKFCLSIKLTNFFFRMVFEYNKAKNHQQIKKIIDTLATQFCISKDVNKRKGGLISIGKLSIYCIFKYLLI